MRLTEKQTTFGVIVGTRGFFNPEHAKNARKETIAKLEKLGYGTVILPADATKHSAVETVRDAMKCAELFRQKADEIDGIIVLLPNFGDEVGVVETISRARLDVPVLVQASCDHLDKVDVAGRRDSFCGKLSVCNNLVQYGIPFSVTESHTVDIDTDEFTADLDKFSRVCRVVKGLTSARVGAIGTRPAAFQTVRYSEKIMQANGITVVPVDLSEIIAGANTLDDDAAAVKARLEAIDEYGRIPSEIARANVIRQAKLGVVIEEFMEENMLDASCIQCWDSIEKNYGCATCLTMSMMSEKLIPSACEVDLAGAVSMYALALASGNPPALLDWNNNYGTEKDKCINTHCSNYPRSFVGREVEISTLDIVGASVGHERCFGAVKGNVAPGDMTFFRLSTNDTEGWIRAYAGEGEFTDDPCDMDGGIAVCKIDNLNGLLKYLSKAGFEHHVAMVRGRWSGILQEAVESYLDWDLYVHE